MNVNLNKEYNMKKKATNGRMFYWTYLTWMSESGIHFNEQGSQSRARRYTKDLLMEVGISHRAENSLSDLYQATCIGR
jgi:hypothetical protein